MSENTLIRVARLPEPGPIDASVFAYETAPLKPLAEGEVRLESLYGTIDAGTRAMLDPASDYVMQLRVGNRMPVSAMVGRVVESRHPDYAEGDYARAFLMTRARYVTFDPRTNPGARRLDPADGPLDMHIGALGMTGFTAWLGVFEVGKPMPGETVLVSAAAGAVGSVAGQLAKAVGARVVGVAGGPDKCAAVCERFGFDDCVDYKAPDLEGQIARACPNGVDVYFENVGGAVQQAAFAAMNRFGRVAMCGQVSQYSGSGVAPGPNLMVVVRQQLTLKGFLSHDYLDRFATFDTGMLKLVRDGTLKPQSTITRGFDQLHAAINSLAGGANIGQQIHQMAEI